MRGLYDFGKILFKYSDLGGLSPLDDTLEDAANRYIIKTFVWFFAKITCNHVLLDIMANGTTYCDIW